MSGTSLDAIDAALLEIERESDTLLLSLRAFTMQPLDNALRQAIRSVLPPNEGSARTICELNFQIAEAFSQAAGAVADEAQIPVREVDLIASHGQTIWHQPDGIRSTLQLGAGGVIAERTGCTVVSDFRPRDLAAGGQGAPLVPYFDALFWRDLEKHRVLLNIGGIANLTYLPPHGEVIAFDTGPGNVLMNEAMRILTNGEKSFDEDGRMASSGTPDSKLLSLWLNDPYVKDSPPKSTGREYFGPDKAHWCLEEGRELGISDADTMASLAKFTTRSISGAIEQFLPRCDEVYVGGGGARNPVLMQLLQEDLEDKVRTTDESGLPADAKEAVAFAVLGYAALHGYPGNVPSATGAQHPVVLGNITPGENYRELLARVSQSPLQPPHNLVLR